MDTDRYVVSSHLNQFEELVRDKKGNITALLKLVGLPDVVLRDKERLIPLDKFIQLLEVAAQQLRVPHFSLELARRHDISFLGPLSMMLYRASTVAEALDIIVKCFRVVVSGVTLNISVTHDAVIFNFDCDLDYIAKSIQYQDYVLASALNTLEALLGRQYPFRGCHFTRVENDKNKIRPYFEYFSCPISFGSESLILSADRKLLDEGLWVNSDRFRVDVSHLVSSKDELEKYVTKIVGFLLSSGLCNVDMVANIIGLSRRSLQRYLSQSSTSFNHIVDSVRANRANQFLFHTNYRLTEIASLLGYRNLSSFTRGYKKWYGIEPSNVRKNCNSNAVFNS